MIHVKKLFHPPLFAMIGIFGRNLIENAIAYIFALYKIYYENCFKIFEFLF